jgi:hypothetical protein
MAKSKSAPASKSASRSRKPAAAAKKKPAAKKPAPAKKPARAKAGGAKLGRPKVSAEEPLYLLFHQDYQARQLFEFLRVQTVKELEQYSPHDIVRRLTQPVHDTVDRIRKALAEKNRCLAGDEQYAVENRPAGR